MIIIIMDKFLKLNIYLFFSHVLRMKEFERERRLKARRNRIEANNHAIEAQ